MKRLSIKKTKKASKKVWWINAFILLSFFVICFFSYVTFFKPIKPEFHSISEKNLKIRLKEPLSPNSIAKQLYSQGLNVDKVSLLPILYLSRLVGRPHPGLYELVKDSSLYDLIYKALKGDTLKSKIVLIEGWPIWKIREAINNHQDLLHKTSDWSNDRLLREINASEKMIEGLFFPSTYIFEPGSDDIEIYKTAYKTLKKKLDKAWNDRDQTITVKNSYELLILASLVEKESGIGSDRKKISSVFHNRLEKKMRLQTDPSVIYGLSESFNGNLTKKDLKRDNPYNSYMRNGLPPTPISSVSFDSLNAAANPEKTDFLYFVANGKGGSVFSDSLSNHEKAVDLYQRKRVRN